MQIGNFNFSIIELRFEPVEQDYRFYGSYYRGILGRYLKSRFCVLRNVKCEDCPLNDKCMYILSFERYKDVLFPPYVINRAKRDSLRIVFVGSFSEFSEIYVDAFSRRLSIKKSGFIDPFSDGLYKKRIITSSVDILQMECDFNRMEIGVSFVRLKKDSKLIPCDNLMFEDILRAVEKRIYLINKFYGDPSFGVFLPKFNGMAEKIECRYENVKRYSNRKKRTMKIPSLDCRFEVEGNIKELYPYLYLASVLNIGTNASMGFGELSLMSKLS